MIQMVDLQAQYQRLKGQIDAEIEGVLKSSRYIGGAVVEQFAANLAQYLGVKHVIPCANGTDALQIAMMALPLKKGDEIIVPAFTYVATAEVIALLGFKPVMVDVDKDTFNITPTLIEKAITSKTKAIVPVHLFGQSVDMEGLMEVANKHQLWVIEDNAQAIGATFTYKNGTKKKIGTIGHIGCTSFFPSKNLGCYGDGGAMMTNDDELAAKLKVIANHGQSRLYYHDKIGVNSRLDAIQAAVLKVKLDNLDSFNEARAAAANYYTQAFDKISTLQAPQIAPFTNHVFHQYTLLVKNGKRDELKEKLTKAGIPCMIYYPVPLYKQKAFAKYWKKKETLPVTESLCNSVISLPMHTELMATVQDKIIEAVLA